MQWRSAGSLGANSRQLSRRNPTSEDVSSSGGWFLLPSVSIALCPPKGP